jgi:putative membrane protein
MNTYDLVRGLHILAVIAWMAGLLFLPRLYAYDAEQQSKVEPLKSEMQGLLRAWQARLRTIILNPALVLSWTFGLWLIHLNGLETLSQPWMIAKLAGVVALTGWHMFLMAEFRRVQGGTSVRTGKFWRMTNEIPFVAAVVMVLSVTTQWTF